MPRAIIPSDYPGRASSSDCTAIESCSADTDLAADIAAEEDVERALPPLGLIDLRFPFGFLRTFGTLAMVAFQHYRTDGNPAKWLDVVLYWCCSWPSFFFLLSGFVLGWRALLPGHSPQPWGVFLHRRLASFYPVYALTILLAAANFGARVTPYGLRGLLAHLTLMQAWYPPYVELWTVGTNNYNSPAWVLSVLFAGWVLLPFLARALGTMLRGTGSCVFVAAFLYLLGPCSVQAFVQWQNWRSWADVCSPRWCAVAWLKFWPALHLPTFALGVVLARWLQLTCQRERWGRGRAPPAALRCAMPVGLVALAALAVCVPMTGSSNTSWPSGTIGWFYFYHDGGLAPLHALLILGGAADALTPPTPGEEDASGCGFLEYLGERSWAIFVSQQWTASLLMHLLENLAPQASRERRTVLLHRFLVPALLMVGCVLYEYVQVPYNRWLLSAEGMGGERGTKH